MGLDWVLLDRPKAGQSERVAQARDELSRIEASRWRSVLLAGRARALQMEIDALVDSPLDEIACPRVGVHAIADDWLRAQWQARRAAAEPAAFLMDASSQAGAVVELDDPWRGGFDEVRARHAGVAVVELCAEPDVLPRWWGVAARRIDFRGQVLRQLEGVLPEALIEEAYVGHDAPAMIDYADRLDDAARAVAATEEITDKLSRLDVVDGAARWLRAWGRRGFAFHAWF